MRPVISAGRGGVRVENESMAGQRFIHAYGQESGGYTFSFRLGQLVANYVQQYLAEVPKADPVPLVSYL
ncbi:hypothetical protein IMZ48_31500 [Candidatus Bathyarchaeota archaeon]|nr:hypothetical protein [Candidatus Bathyarchaeota archaeon]